MTTKAEQKRIRGEYLVAEADALNCIDRAIINRHVDIPEILAGRLRDELLFMKRELSDPHYNELLTAAIWLVCIIIFPLIPIPLRIKKKREEERFLIAEKNERIKKDNDDTRKIIAALNDGDSKAMQSFTRKVIAAYGGIGGYETKFQWSVADDGRSMAITMFLPNETELPQYTHIARKTTEEIIRKKKKDKELHQNHSILVHSTALRVAAACFSIMPTIANIDCDVYTKRRNKANGQLEDESILRVVFNRSRWETIDFAHIDPIAVYENFSATRTIGKNGALIKI